MSGTNTVKEIPSSFGDWFPARFLAVIERLAGHYCLLTVEETEASYAFGRSAKVCWERNEKVEGIATVAGVTEIQVPLLQKCSAEGAPLWTLADPGCARGSLLVLPALL